MTVLLSVVSVLAILFLSIFLAWWVPYRQAWWKLRNVPGPPQQGLLGNAAGFFANHQPHINLLQWRRRYGAFFKIRLAHQIWVVVADAVAIANVLSRHNDKVEKPLFALKILDDVLLKGTPGIFTSATNSYWKAVRKSVAKSFSSDALRKQYHHVQHCLSRLLTVIECSNGAAFDIDELALCLTIEVIGKVGFDYEMRCMDDVGQRGFMNTLKQALEEAGKTCLIPFRRFQFWDPTLTPGRRAMRDFYAYMQQLTRLLTARGECSDDDSSIIAQLRRVVDPSTHAPLTPAQLQAEIATMFNAGFDTTGHSLAWAMLCITAHPDVERAIVQELDSFGLLATESNPKLALPTYDQLSKLVYINAVMKESMRMVPILGQGLFRVVKQEFQIQGVTMPKGAVLVLNAYSTQNDSALWQDAQAFCPERWLSGGDSAVGSNVGGTQGLSYFPFGSGSRDCVGQNLAKLEIVAALAALYARFSFRVAEGWTYERVRSEEVVSVMLHPRNGILMHASPRVAAKN